MDTTLAKKRQTIQYLWHYLDTKGLKVPHVAIEIIIDEYEWLRDLPDADSGT